MFETETPGLVCYPEDGNKSCLVIRLIVKLQSELQLGNLAEAEETLQTTYKHLQASTSNDFSNPSLEEKQIINQIEQTFITNAPWNSKNGTILLPQTCSQNLFVRSLNVCGVLALQMYSLAISVAAFEQSVSHIDNADEEINRDAHTCARCKTRMSAYFCSICKHFTGEDKHPYHCTKCGICRIHKDRSFHCDVCNVCLDKRLQGKHKCRPDSGHDECCICLEDAFSGCQILPCSHKVHRECAIAMIQNGVRSCPICRHPLYSQSAGTE